MEFFSLCFMLFVWTCLIVWLIISLTCIIIIAIGIYYTCKHFVEVKNFLTAIGANISKFLIEVLNIIYFSYETPKEMVLALYKYIADLYYGWKIKSLDLIRELRESKETSKKDALSKSTLTTPLIVDDEHNGETIWFGEYEVDMEQDAIDLLVSSEKFKSLNAQHQKLALKTRIVDFHKSRNIVVELAARVRKLLNNGCFDGSEESRRVVTAHVEQLLQGDEYIVVRFLDYNQVINNVLKHLSKPTTSWLDLQNSIEDVKLYKEMLPDVTTGLVSKPK